MEIWTNDAATINGFERVPLKSFDFAPTVVLRFEKKHLVDVSSEFTPQYDGQIANLRAQMDPRELAAFKSSDGVLSMEIPRSSDELHRLTRTKIEVLEIVWAYLYSGRDAEAWSALQGMWPPQDFERIRMKAPTFANVEFSAASTAYRRRLRTSTRFTFMTRRAFRQQSRMCSILVGVPILRSANLALSNRNLFCFAARRPPKSRSFAPRMP